MVDRVECSGVYIDDRVRSERWVRRNSIATSTISEASSFTVPEEPEALQADVEQLLDVCKKSMSPATLEFVSRRLGEYRLTSFKSTFARAELPLRQNWLNSATVQVAIAPLYLPFLVSISVATI